MTLEPTPARAPSFWRRALLPFACAIAFGAVAAPSARAEDEGGGGDPQKELEAKIKAQMEKIVRLMKENEDALLNAASRGGKAPSGVDVVPPEGSAMDGSAPGADGSKNGSNGEGATGPATGPKKGEDARKAIEELMRLTVQQGGTIPKEIEELVKLIPT
jgi:hypothetical protein